MSSTKELLALVAESEAADKAYDAQPTPDAARRSEVAHFAVVKAAYQALPALCAEVEAQRKHAERYRWLITTKQSSSEPILEMWSKVTREGRSYPTSEEWDAAIDAAKEPK